MLRQVLDLGLAEDDVGVRSRGLVDVGFVDDEEDALRLADADARDAMDGLEA